MMVHTDSIGAGHQRLDLFEIRLEGEFDASERERVTDAFAVANSAPLVVLNLSETTYIDSTILQCFIALEMATRQRGAHLVLTGVSGSVRRLLEVSSFDGYFDLQPDSAIRTAQSLDGGVRRLTLVSAIDTTDNR